MNQDHSEKWLLPPLGQEICNMSLEYLVVPESLEMLKKNRNDGIISKEQMSQPKDGQSWINLTNKIKYWVITQSIK